jgi:hypothetical protein
MHVPGLLERVRLEGMEAVYLVTRVDYEGQLADLYPILYGQRSLAAVPFVVIEAIAGVTPPNLGPVA